MSHNFDCFQIEVDILVFFSQVKKKALVRLKYDTVTKVKSQSPLL